MPKNAHRRPLAAKPEVEIWRKPRQWTRSHGLPIRLPIHYWVYLDAIWHFTRDSLLLGPCKRALDLEIFHEVCAQLRFFAFLKPICSEPWRPIFPKISRVVEGVHVSRISKTRYNRGPNFSAMGVQTHDHREYSIDHNSKPEVEIDTVPTALITVPIGLKCFVSNFREVAPQVP